MFCVHVYACTLYIHVHVYTMPLTFALAILLKSILSGLLPIELGFDWWESWILMPPTCSRPIDDIHDQLMLAATVVLVKALSIATEVR